ncbi:MAG TPA: hypothetical protein VHM65_11095, partial [Candidatus Lustribacter sp.]|nr:hypothetical protein [Candidatus Lustribacter sp.]
MDDAASLAGSAVRHLSALAHVSGGWTDFWVGAGTSTSWVTGYAGHALGRAAYHRGLPRELRALAHASAASAVGALERQQRHGAWGWSPAVRADADSTAWCVRALVSMGRPVGSRTWDFLAGHRSADGYRTYRPTEQTGRWAQPMPEVTAVVLLAYLEADRITPAELGERWLQWCGPTGPWT